MTHATVPTIPVAALTPAQIALVGYLARYTGGTHDLYRYHLTGWFTWCETQSLDPLADPTRAHVELFIRHLLTDRGLKPSTVANIMAPIKGYFRFAVIDGLIDRNPAEYAHVPKVQRDDSRLLAFDRLELSRFLATARTISPRHHALAYMLGILGLRVSEACSVRVEDYAETERGHRVLRLVGKGGKPATVPLTVPVLRALDDAAGDRTAGLVVTTLDGRPLDRHSAPALVDTICRRAGLPRVSPHKLRHSAITAALDAGVPLRDVQYMARHSDPRTTMRYDRARHNHDRHAVHVLTAFLAGGA